jgi:predicted  nucleic acid-binding Zn-ribbon protein
MLDVIEKLLILQDRDRKILRTKGQLDHIEPERQQLKTKTSDAQAALARARERMKRIESDRKSLELEVESKKELIAKYSNQQLQTRKNEEYRALSHEIEMCREDIRKIEDRELALMEEAELAQAEAGRANAAFKEANQVLEENLTKLGAREENLKQEISSLEGNRQELAAAVGDSALGRYERLMRNKGDKVVVGIQHGVCGGCHMRVPAQVLVSCQAQQELISCTNCGRILYYSRDMDLALDD